MQQFLISSAGAIRRHVRFFFLLSVAITGTAILVHASAFPGKNGKIVYRSFDVFGLDGGNHLHSINPDGTGDQDLTPNLPGVPNNNSNEPAVSPDGTKLAFSSDRDHGFNLQTEIYVENMDGTGLQRLTLSAFGASQPTWSPDGKKIAFTQGNTISVINADGTGQAVIFTDPSFRLPNPKPSWSPDGTTIAFAANGPDFVGRIYLMNADGSGVHTLTSGQDLAPTWSPDGSQLAFASVRNSGGEIYLVSATGGDGPGNTPIVSIQDGGGGNPAWSPDGTKIVHEGNGTTDSTHGIFVLDLQSHIRARLTAGSHSQPAWGPAVAPVNLGTTALLSPLPNGAGWNNSNVTVTLNAGGSAVQKITFAGTGAQVIPSTSVNGATAQIPITAEGPTIISYFATDNAGNAETPHTVTVNIDKTAPAIIGTANPVPNLNGWNNTDVTVTFNATDALSEIALVSSPVTVATEGRNQIINGIAGDVAGNTGSAAVALNIDKTPPEGSLRFDPATLLPVLSGRDSLSGVDMDVAPRVLGGAPLRNGRLVQYTVLDLAGNTVVLIAQVGQLLPGSQNAVIRIQSVQYNGGPQLQVPTSDVFIQKINSDVLQSVRLDDAGFPQVSAFYRSATNTTEIMKLQLDRSGNLSAQVTTVPGMVKLGISTNKGNLSAEFF